MKLEKKSKNSAVAHKCRHTESKHSSHFKTETLSISQTPHMPLFAVRSEVVKMVAKTMCFSCAARPKEKETKPVPLQSVHERMSFYPISDITQRS